MSALKCAPPFHSSFNIRLHKTLLSSFHFSEFFVPCRFVLSYFFSFLLFSRFHKPLQTDNRLPVFFHGFLSKRACLLSPIFLFPLSLFSHAFTCILFSTIRGGNLIVIICQWNFFKKKISFQVILVRPLVPWTRISSVYWHVIVTPPSRPLTLLEQRIQANWK